MRIIQRVQQPPLEMHPAGARKIDLELIAHPFFEGAERRHSELLGQLVVDRQCVGRLHLFHLDGEFDGPASQLRVGIVSRKVDLHDTLVSRPGRPRVAPRTPGSAVPSRE